MGIHHGHQASRAHAGEGACSETKGAPRQDRRCYEGQSSEVHDLERGGGVRGVHLEIQQEVGAAGCTPPTEEDLGQCVHNRVTEGQDSEDEVRRARVVPIVAGQVAR